MEDNKKDYSDFFKPNDHKDEDPYKENDGKKEDRPPYYYSYGPYSSRQNEASSEAASSSPEDSESVEMTAPRPVKPYPYVQEQQVQTAPTTSNWKLNEPRKRSSVKSMFSAFMAGAVLVGGLMFASDQMNLFTGDKAAGNGGGGSVPTNSASSNSGGITGASLDISRPGSVSSIVEQSQTAVVKIDTYVTAKQRSRSDSLFNDDIFRYFFGDSAPKQQQPKAGTKQKAGMGTGFIFEKSGYILTNQHVVDGADEIEVTVEGFEKPFSAKLLGNSFELDLAVLKIEGEKEFATLPIGDSQNMKIGDWVVAIGNPYGFEHTVTVGVLSAKEREISIPEQQGTRNYKHLFQTDASINPGNSGGPLLNMNGEVVGINTAVNAQAQGIGFAIPTSTISEVLENLKNNVTIPKEPAPYIGAQLSDLQSDWLKELKIESTDGALVEDVLFGTPAFKAGLKKYDVITSIDGAAVKKTEELIAKIKTKKPGDKAVFGIVRDGKKMDIEITIGDKNEYNQNQQQ